MSAPWIYVVVRKDLRSDAAIVQAIHAATECLEKDDVPVASDTRGAYLGATKAELAAVLTLLAKDEVKHRAIVEPDGPLKGMLTAVGFVVAEKARVESIVGHLPRWREGKEDVGVALSTLRRWAEAMRASVNEPEKLLAVIEELEAY
jgi:hypothetical protein